jgi:hypothetical protein
MRRAFLRVLKRSTYQSSLSYVLLACSFYAKIDLNRP